jgi:tRNA nucleotidyltransferase (CCA-adding enzyme)
MSYDPEAILWLGFISKDKAVQERFNLFLKVWPEARQRIPLPADAGDAHHSRVARPTADLVQNIFLELIDGHLTTPEEMRAYLEPHSPPAPPPQVTIKRSRARRAGARIKEQAIEDEDAEDVLVDEDVEPVGADDEELDLAILPKGALAVDLDADGDEEDELEAEEAEAAPASKKLAGKKGQKPEPALKPAAAKPTASAAPAKPLKPEIKNQAKGQPATVVKKPAAAAAQLKSAKPAKSAVKAPAPAKGKAPGTKAQKSAAKAPAKKPAPVKAAKPKPKPKPPAKPVKKAHARPSKPAAKKPAAKKAQRSAKGFGIEMAICEMNSQAESLSFSVPCSLGPCLRQIHQTFAFPLPPIASTLFLVPSGPQLINRLNRTGRGTRTDGFEPIRICSGRRQLI